MASPGGFAGFKELKPAILQHIISISEYEGKTYLAEELGIPPYNDKKDPQKAPFISYIYDNIIFASERGFPWEHIWLVVKVAHEYLKKILVEKHQISDAIKDFKEISKLLDPLSDKHKKQYTDYIFETVLCHYKLYKYVFSHSRDVLHPVMEKEIHVPEKICPLSEGKTIAVYEYDAQLEKIKEKAQLEKSELKHNYIRTKEESDKIKVVDAFDNAPVPFSKATLTSLLQDALKGYMSAKEKELKAKVQVVAKDLDYKIEKTALSRPLELGSPPRFKPMSNAIDLKSANSSSSSLMGRRKSRAGNSGGSSAVSKKK